MSKRSFRARHPLIKSESGRCENKLSRTTSFKKWKWKMWNRSFRARIPSKSESGRCQNEAFVRDMMRHVIVVILWKCWFSENGDIVVILWWCWCCDSGDIVIVVILWLWWYSGDFVIVVI
jgi:hypothetical protein